MIYIHEAHPNDGWQVPKNIEDGWILNEPATWDERKKVAENFLAKTKLSIPTLIDDMDNKADNNYKAWPDRVYVIGIDGKIIYKGGQGPQEFKPLEIVPFLDTASAVKLSRASAIIWGFIKRS